MPDLAEGESETFTCDACGRTFPKERSDEEARAEADDLWGDALGDDPAVICDDCFRGMNQ